MREYRGVMIAGRWWAGWLGVLLIIWRLAAALMSFWMIS